MQLASKTSRWESIPTRQSPRFPRNVHRTRRGPPKLARRHSSQRNITDASLKQLQSELNDKFDIQEGNLAPRRATLLDGILDNKVRYDRKNHPVIIVRRSTTTTACSEITFDSGYFSVDDNDYDDDDDDDVSEEASLVDDDDDEDTITVAHRPSKATLSHQPTLDTYEEDEEDDDCDIPVPRILIFGLEPRRRMAQVHPIRVVTEQVSKEFSTSNHKNVQVDTAVILTESQLDDDSRDSEYVLAMASIKKNIQRTTSQPDAVIVITSDSDSSDVTLEGYHHMDQTSANTKVFSLLEALRVHEIPACAKPRYGTDACKQWSDRFQTAGLSTSPPIIFFHLPPSAQTAYQQVPYLKPETSAKGVSIAVSRLAKRLANKRTSLVATT
ncbi:expressed unknown protein [Seminavis robusta]|uniref:Uncharacterized protein n=1 Tax=Seminavis robusta TaxID=568900 RepID=A0A9N8EPV8_9STRA|nr:expressed unknown protein [Seminavis robusta]|eukprot:Sro1557_g282260.1 n/a (384) ;mRNA; f:14775-15926